MKQVFTLLFIGLFCCALQPIRAQQKPDIVEFSGQRPSPDTLVKSTENQQVVRVDTLKPFVLQIIWAGDYYQSSRLIFSFTNRSGQFVDNFWMQASLLDKRQSFLYREQPLFFTKVKNGQSASAEIICESIFTSDIGTVVLYPMLLEVDDDEQTFDIERIELLPEDKFGIRLEFDTRL